VGTADYRVLTGMSSMYVLAPYLLQSLQHFKTVMCSVFQRFCDNNSSPSMKSYTDFQNKIREKDVTQTDFQNKIREKDVKQTDFQNKIREKDVTQTDFQNKIREKDVTQTEFQNKIREKDVAGGFPE